MICSPRLSIQTCPGVQVCERPRVEDIAPGEGVDVTVRLAAGDAVGECCTLRAVLCFQSERQGECRLVSDVCRVAVSRVEANVRICKQISPSGAVAPGECVKVCLTVRNTGNVPLKEVCVTDEIPEGMRYCPGSTRVGGGPESAAFDKNPADGILLACLRPGETIRITYCICAHIAPEPR